MTARTPDPLTRTLHEAKVGCTWDEQIPRQRMCDSDPDSYHEHDAENLRLALLAELDRNTEEGRREVP